MKTIVSTKVVTNYPDKADELVKSANQTHMSKKRDKIKAQSEVIQQQKKEIENVKAANVKMYLEKLIEVMTQAITCMYNMQKGPSKNCVELSR